jgi:hypothetical protein
MTIGRNPQNDVIDAGTLHLTLGAQCAALVGAIVVGLDPLLGKNFTHAQKTAIIIAAVALIAITHAADVLARAWATAAKGAATAATAAGTTAAEATKTAAATAAEATKTAATTAAEATKTAAAATQATPLPRPLRVRVIEPGNGPYEANAVELHVLDGHERYLVVPDGPMDGTPPAWKPREQLVFT